MMTNLRVTPSTLFVCSVLAASITLGEPSVTPVKLPYGGIRAQAAVDQSGLVHIVQADSNVRGRLVYVTHRPGSDGFSQPIPVLQDAKDMAASFNMTVSGNGRVHVMTRPNPKYSKQAMGADAFDAMFKSKARFFVLRYMLHSRLNDAGTAFEEETNLVGDTIGFEGVGDVVADPDNQRVYAFWPGQTEPGPEMGRDLYMAVSKDEGATWSEPKRLDLDIEGNCRCCPLQASIGADGALYVIHRNSVKTSPTSWDKDTYLLKSTDGGESWTKTLIQKWENCGCPGAPYSMANGPDGVVFGFSTRGVSSFAKESDLERIYSAPSSGKPSTRPGVAINKKGDVLFCWVEGQDVLWQAYDASGKAMSQQSGRLENVAARWSNAAVVATPSDDFVLYYDGDFPPPPVRKRAPAAKK